MFDRKKQLKLASLKVGIVVTVSLGIVFFVIVFSGGIENMVKKKVSFDVYISDVKGLRKGAPVRVAGVDVGAVKDIRLNKEYGTVVTLSINKEVLDYLKADSRATVQTIGLLGDKYIEITPGVSSEPFDPSRGMLGNPQIELREVILTATSTINKVERLIARFDILIEKLDRAEGTLPKLFFDPTLYNNLNSTVAELRQTLTEIRSGSLMEISKDKELHQRVLSTFRNLDEASKKIASSEGSLGKLINDPQLYENLIKTTQRLDSLIESIEKSEGAFSVLLKDKKTADELRDTVRQLKELVEEIKKNPKKFFKFSIF